VRARSSSPREVVGGVDAHDGTSEDETVCRFFEGSLTGHSEESDSHAQAYGGRSRRKAFWIVRNARSSPGVREAVLACR